MNSRTTKLYATKMGEERENAPPQGGGTYFDLFRPGLSPDLRSEYAFAENNMQIKFRRFSGI